MFASQTLLKSPSQVATVASTLLRGLCSTNAAAETPIVNIPGLGSVKGSSTEGAWTGRKIFQFLGLKYAEAPNGARRFKAPVPALPWENIRDVTKYGRACPAYGNIMNIPNEELGPDAEDCLSLCIYSTDLTAKRPVMVYIHGGGFFEGASFHHPPQYLLEKDIVLVVPQFRVGPLGFLSTKTDVIPGNAGILDVILAFEWVQKYISNFGGDPDRVTAFGQSAGAGIVSALTYSPIVNENLFNKVILQSGASMGTWIWDENCERNARDIARIGGCNPTLPLEDINSCLMEMDVKTLTGAFTHHMLVGIVSGVNTIGGHRMTIGGPSNFLPINPYQIMRAGGGRKNLPMIAGVAKHDGSFSFAMTYDLSLTKIGTEDTTLNRYKMLDIINTTLGIDEITGSLAGFQILNLFKNNEISNGNFNDMIDGFIDICGSIVIKGPTLRAAQANAYFNPTNTWLYSFDYRGEFTRFGYGADTSHYPFDGGVHHSDDNIYLFPWPENVAKLNEEDTKIAKKFVDLWTSFAINGKPSSADVPSWPAMTNVVGPYLHIDKTTSIGENFYDEFSVASREEATKIKHQKLKEKQKQNNIEINSSDTAFGAIPNSPTNYKDVI